MIMLRYYWITKK